MIADTPQALLIALGVVTFLGGVIGFCIAQIREKKRAVRAIDELRAGLSEQQALADEDLQSAHVTIEEITTKLTEANKRCSAAIKREAALELHARLQAQRIQTLESQAASYEDRQIRLQRDFARYKSNKARELELARNKPDSWSVAEQLPVLQKRKSDPLMDPESTFNSFSSDNMSNSGASSALRARAGLSIPLSRELDIPSLSESELPDSVDELDFEIADIDDSEHWPRG